MRSNAATVDQYLSELPADRREVIQRVREVILENLPKGYQEGMQYGMIGYSVPHSIYPAGYHCDPKQPLPFMSIAAQKNGYSLHMFCIYCSEGRRSGFEEAWRATGKRLDMGKACVRFKKLDDVPLDVVGRAVRIPVKEFIEKYETMLKGPRPERTTPKKAASGKSAKQVPGKKTAKRTVTKKTSGKKAATKKTVKKAAGRSPKAAKSRTGLRSAGRSTGRKTAKDSRKTAKDR